MATRKKNKKAPPKKKRYIINQTNPMKTMLSSKIVYENSDDSWGTIKIVNEGQDAFDEMEKAMASSNLPSDFSTESYSNLIKKFEKAKDKKKLRFNDFELDVLRKALDNCLSYFAMKGELSNMKHELAWANTAFKDKGYSYEENLREAGRRLGFTRGVASLKTSMPYSVTPKGKKLKHDPKVVTSYYKKLIKSGIDRKDAVEKLVVKFPFASPDTCSRYLRKNGLKNIPSFRESSARPK
jgi:hypothetical protein